MLWWESLMVEEYMCLFGSLLNTITQIVSYSLFHSLVLIGNAFKLKGNRFRFNIRKKFFPVRAVRHLNFVITLFNHQL